MPRTARPGVSAPSSGIEAPAIMRNYCLGKMIGGMFALAQRRPINRLAILDRFG
jgi:hypothetical protein